MKVQVIRAWPDHHVVRAVELSNGASLGDAVSASGIDMEGVVGFAIYGERATMDAPLREGDRVELLGALLADPKQARRKRASAKAG